MNVLKFFLCVVFKMREKGRVKGEKKEKERVGEREIYIYREGREGEGEI